MCTNLVHCYNLSEYGTNQDHLQDGHAQRRQGRRGINVWVIRNQPTCGDMEEDNDFGFALSPIRGPEVGTWLGYSHFCDGSRELEGGHGHPCDLLAFAQDKCRRLNWISDLVIEIRTDRSVFSFRVLDLSVRRGATIGPPPPLRGRGTA